VNHGRIRGNDTWCQPLHVSSVELGRYCHRLVVVIEGSISDICVAGRRLHQSVGTSSNQKRDHQYDAQAMARCGQPQSNPYQERYHKDDEWRI
jgi:hypothetical protein